MKSHTINKVLGITAATISTIFAVGQPARAFSFSDLNSEFTTLDSDWHVVQDATNDAYGGSFYDMYGMAARVEDNQIYFAINGNMARNRSTGWINHGDLFLNFSGESFRDASAAGRLFAIHFEDNDGGGTDYGLYRNVSARSVIGRNGGRPTFNAYLNTVDRYDRNSSIRENPILFGDLDATEARQYLTERNGRIRDGRYRVQNVIRTGERVENDGFSFLSPEELAGVFGSQRTGNNMFGFSLSLDALPTGDALISILHECANDSMGMTINLASNDNPSETPEPSSIVSLSLIGLALAGIRKKANQ